MTNRLYDIEYSKNKNKPKLSINNAINKFIISWGININKTTAIYYAWDNNDVNYLINNRGKISSHILVDYNHNKREWYINYVDKNLKIYSGLIDDITGRINLQNV